MTTIDVLGRTVTIDVADNEFVVDAVVIVRTQSAEDANSQIRSYGSSADHFITASMLNAAHDFIQIGGECTCDDEEDDS